MNLKRTQLPWLLENSHYILQDEHSLSLCHSCLRAVRRAQTHSNGSQLSLRLLSSPCFKWLCVGGSTDNLVREGRMEGEEGRER